jgi:hypothetical protein
LLTAVVLTLTADLPTRAAGVPAQPPDPSHGGANAGWHQPAGASDAAAVPAPALTPRQFAELYGIEITRIAVIAAGGLVDVRFRV